MIVRCGLAIALLLASFNAAAETLNDIVNDPERPLASAAVLAIRDGKVVYRAHAGCKRFEADRCVPTGPDDLYRIASVSKMVVALGVLRLVDEGKVDLDRDIGDYLGYRVRHPDDPDRALTLRRLLSHTAGLTDAAGYRVAPGADIRALLTASGPQWGAKKEVSAAGEGAYFRYANLNFGVVASVMERASGERFDRLMRRLVLDPLGLRGGFNTASFGDAERAALATLYRRGASAAWEAQVDATASAGDVAPPNYVLGSNGTLYGPQGSLRMSAAGLGVIAQVLMQQGVHNGRPFLSPAAMRELLRVHWRSNGNNGDEAKGLFKAWGLGVQLFDGSGVLRGAGHLGDAYGLLSGVAFDPATRSAVVYIIGGMAFDPYAQPSRRSALTRIEERLLDHTGTMLRP